MMKKYLFIDECGDPHFYAGGKKLLVGTEGFQPLLILGALCTEDRKTLRHAVESFRTSILSDPLYNSIYSIRTREKWYLHAKDDPPEVRAKFFEFLRSLEGVKAYFVIGRKRLDVFRKRHNNNPSEFYFDLLHHLLKDRLNQEDEFYQLYLAQRQKTTMPLFTTAVESAISKGNSKRKKPIIINYQCDIVKSSEYPEMSVVDYLLWGVQRYILKGEKRFFSSVEDKYNLIVDLYDFDKYNKKGAAGGTYYSRTNPFDVSKASPFV